jgi:hypothetical protein
MSLSTRTYSKQMRSSSFYSRSSSHHASANHHCHALAHAERPLSRRLIERDFSAPSLIFDCFDPFDIDFRRRCQWDDDFFRFYFGLGRTIPVDYRQCVRPSRSIPIEYRPSSSAVRRHDENALGKILFVCVQRGKRTRRCFDRYSSSRESSVRRRLASQTT